MILSLHFTIISAVIIIPSIPLYVILLYSLWKYRKKRPFTSPFFKISFHLGIFDLLHLFNDWFIGILPHLGPHNFILKHETVFAKQFAFLWGYSALAQKLGIVLLAVDRLTSISFGHVRNLQSNLDKWDT